jgi:hypothetical protein
MIEDALLKQVAQFLGGRTLTPAPAIIGVSEPGDNTQLPAIVLSLAGIRRPVTGLGERSELMTGGALAWSAIIDLANPALPEDRSFNLLSADRKTLNLPHGGLVRREGTEAAVGAGDLTVTVGGVPVATVTGPPAAGEVRADGLAGALEFGAPLPATGLVAADYFLGRWERRVARLEGTLRIGVRAATAEAVRTLSEGALEALETRWAPALSGLHEFQLAELSSVGPPDAPGANARSREQEFDFRFELVVDRPESSGGIIRRVPAVIHLGLA